MITLKFNQSIAGNNFSHQRGDEVDWYDDEDALGLIDAGIAKPLCDYGKSAYAEYRQRKLANAKPVKVERRDNKKPETKPPVDEMSPADTEPPVPIEKLDLDEQTLKVLKAAGLETVGQVKAHEDLAKITGIAKATKDKILKAVAAV